MMRIFEERQRFNQWWIYVICGLLLFVIVGGIYKNSNGFTNFDNPGLTLVFLLGLLPLVFLLVLRQDTRIDPEGITTKFYPLWYSRKFFPWKKINEIYVRKYRSIPEYGGRGIRSGDKKKAYSVAGNLGIQIVTTEDEKFLIGTQQPDAARAVLLRYQHRTYNKKKSR